MTDENHLAREMAKVQTALVRIESKQDRICSWLRSELGYDSESTGNVNRRINDNYRLIADAVETLRGRGDEMGIVGWVNVLRRTWIAVVGSGGMAIGYLLNEVLK